MATGKPLIIWGDFFENTIACDYPLYDWVTRSEALEGSQFLRIESGQEDSWVVNISYVLEGNISYITQEQWDDEWVPFLQWARQKNQFKWLRDETATSVLSYLVSPIDEAPTLEPDGTYSIRLVIRNTVTPYEIGGDVFDPYDTIPSENLVLWLDNSSGSYGGMPSQSWNDLSGNDYEFVLTSPTGNSPWTFDRNKGFYFNYTPAPTYTKAFARRETWVNDTVGGTVNYPLLTSNWPTNSPMTSSMTVFFGIQATGSVGSYQGGGIFGAWGPLTVGDGAPRFIIGLKSNGALESGIGLSYSTQVFLNTEPNVKVPFGQTTNWLYELSGSAQVFYSASNNGYSYIKEDKNISTSSLWPFPEGSSRYWTIGATNPFSASQGTPNVNIKYIIVYDKLLSTAQKQKVLEYIQTLP